jgi:two-component system phosphate regulon sensor histidine kinase PhoR
MRWPISFKLALTYLGVVCVAGAPVLLLLDRELTAGLRERRDQELVTRARLIATLLAADPAGPLDAQVAALDPVADRLAAIADARVTLIAPDGRVVGDSALDPRAVVGVENHLGRPEVQEALATGTGLSSRRSHTTGAVFRYAAVPFATPAGRGVVRLALPQAGAEAPLRAVRERVLVAGGLALALGFVLSLVVGRAVSAPLRAMTRIATQLATGASAERVRVRRGDELGDLAEAMNRLAADLARTVGQLEGEKEQLRGVLEGMAEGVLLIDPAGRIALANRAAAAVLPHGEGATGRTPLEVTRSAELDALVRAARASGRAERGQVSVGGGARAFDASVIPLAEPAGGLVVVLHDITEVKRLETVRREFVANISHELRTPLTAIRGFIDTLKDDPNLSEAERARFLDGASRHAVRLSNLVGDLLALSRLDSPEFKLELMPCSLEAEIARALELHETRARERGLRLAADLEPGLPPVLADPAGLEQILSNLIDNAIKYNRPGGSVVVRAARAGLFAQVEVEDTGVGIAGQHVPRIFERLYRVDPGRSRAEGGTGLGLAIVKHLVLKHGGDVWVTSEPGRGSTFHFTLHFAPGGQRTGETRLSP